MSDGTSTTFESYSNIVNGMIKNKFYILSYLPEETWSNNEEWEEGSQMFKNILNNKQANINYINDNLKKGTKEFGYIN